MSNIALYTIFGGIAALCGILTQFEVDDDIVLTSKYVSLSATRAKAFQYVADMRNYAKWCPGIINFEPADSTPMGMGKHFYETQEYPLYGEVIYNNMIIGYESPKVVSMISDTWLGLRVDMAFERRDSTMYPSEMTYTVYTRKRSYLFKYIIGPIMRLSLESKVRQALLNLKMHFS